MIYIADTLESLGDPEIGYDLTFETEENAQQALSAAGFSLGKLQADAPRGVMYGNYDIQKWRNLNAMHRAGLHGFYQRQHRKGPARVVLTKGCPQEAIASLKAVGRSTDG